MEQSGVYSVRSAYKYIQVEKGAWCREENDEIWSRLWKIKAPPKCLNLVWRALSFNLPTLSQLQQKHVTVSNVCPFCRSGPETIVHVLVSCPFASKCWHILDSNFQVTMGDDFLNWLKSTLVGANKEKEAMVVMLCWSLWRARNDRSFTASLYDRGSTPVVTAARYFLCLTEK